MFPISSSISRRLASLHRLLLGWCSPTSTVLSRRSDFPLLLSLRFVPFARRYHGCARYLCSCVSSHAQKRLGVLLPTPCGTYLGNKGISQVPVSPLLSVCSCSSTPAGSTSSDLLESSMLLPLAGRRKLQQSLVFRGSIATLSDFLCTLRSDDYSFPTQHSVPAVGQTFPCGLFPQGTHRKVFDNFNSSPSCLLSSDFLAQPAFPCHSPGML